jgi:hypothetical protein
MSYLLAAAAVVVAAPLVAAVLVTVASLREDSSKSLAGRPPGALTAAARRLLGVRTSTSADADSAPGQRRPAVPPQVEGADGLLQSHADFELPAPRSDWPDQTPTMPRS